MASARPGYTDGSYFVSTPKWTVRVDVRNGLIQRTSARYVRAAHGLTWGTWRRWLLRQYGETAQIVALEEAG